MIGENAAETEVETEGETQAETVTRAETVMGESTSETVKVTAITFERPELSMEVGSTVRLKTTITPTDADNQKLTWKSSDENIVKIVKDELQAVGEGTVTITVTTEDGGKKAECKITVTKKAVQESPEPQQTTDNSLDDAQVETKQPETDKPEEEKIPEDNQSEVTDTLS